MVTGLWHDMVTAVGQQHKNLPPLLAMCKPLAVEHQTIILGFDYPIFKEKFDKMPGATEAVVMSFRALERNGVHHSRRCHQRLCRTHPPAGLP